MWLPALLALAAAAPVSREVVPASIQVLSVGCGAELPEIRELRPRLSLELDAVPIVDGGAAAVLVVVTSCEGVVSLVLQSGDSPSGRDVSLSDVAPELRGAALAVLVAEFVRSAFRGEESPATPEALAQVAEAKVAVARFEPEPASAPTPPQGAEPSNVVPLLAPTPPSAPPRNRPAAPPRPRPSVPGAELAAVGLVHWFPSPGSLLYGGELTWREPWLFGGAGAAFGRHTDSLGELSLGLAAATAGLRFEVARDAAVSLILLGVVDVGWSWASAQAGDARAVAGQDSTLFAAATAGGELSVALGGDLAALVSLRGGAARGLSVTADGRAVTGTQGAILSGALGLAYTVAP